MSLVAVVGTAAMVLLQQQGQSTDKSRIRILKSEVARFRDTLREYVDDPLLCGAMLRGQPFTAFPAMTPLATVDMGHNVELTLSIGVMTGTKIAPGVEIGVRSVSTDSNTLQGFRINAVKLYSDEKLKGIVVLDRPMTINPLTGKPNPDLHEHWYDVYEVGLGVSTDSSGSIAGMGAVSIPVMERPGLIPMIIQVNQNTGLIHDCYSLNSIANFCRMIDMYTEDPPSAVPITGGYDTAPPWWGSGEAEYLAYSPYRCHPETCRIVTPVPGALSPSTAPIASAWQITTDEIKLKCPSPPYTAQIMDRTNGAFPTADPAPTAPESKLCMWCNASRDLPDGLGPPAAPISPWEVCPDTFEYRQCIGAGTFGSQVIYYAGICPDGSPWTKVRKDTGESTVWSPTPISTLWSGDGNNYTVEGKNTGFEYLVTGTPVGPTCFGCTSCSSTAPL